ncbi:hypothetical protein Tco_1060307 [Tanacetum coccineum]
MQCSPLTEASSLRDRNDVEAFKDVIEDEPHFITKIVDNDLLAKVVVAMVGELVSWREEARIGCGEMGGVEKISSIGSKFMVDGEDCLDGCDGAGGGEVKGGGVDLGVIKSFSGEIPGETMGESGGDIIRLGGGPVW